MTDRFFGDERTRLCDEHADTVQPFVGAEREHQFQNRGVGGKTLAVLEGVDHAGRRHHFEAFIDADEEFRRNDRSLDGAELHPLDLARDRAELARRVDLALDASAGIPLDRGREVLCQKVRTIIDGRRRHLHYVGLFFRLSRAERQREGQSNGASGNRGRK